MKNLKALLALFITTAVIATPPLTRIHPDCIRADLSADNKVTVRDLQLIIDYVHYSGVLTCHQVMLADINRDRKVDETDIIKLTDELNNPPNDVYAWGDINGDGTIAELDITKLYYYLTDFPDLGDSPMPQIGYSTGDISGDGVIDDYDVSIFEDCDAGSIDSPFDLPPSGSDDSIEPPPGPSLRG